MEEIAGVQLSEEIHNFIIDNVDQIRMLKHLFNVAIAHHDVFEEELNEAFFEDIVKRYKAGTYCYQ